DVDLFEVNEAFACVAMAPMHALGIPHDKLNVHGGACALGHPIGASGARLVVTLIHALQRHGGKRGVAALCIGGGEATAVAIELACVPAWVTPGADFKRALDWDLDRDMILPAYVPARRTHPLRNSNSRRGKLPCP